VQQHRPGMCKKFRCLGQPSDLPAGKSGDIGVRETDAAALGVQELDLRCWDKMLVSPSQ